MLYLSKLPQLSSSFHSTVAFLSSLKEITVSDQFMLFNDYNIKKSDSTINSSGSFLKAIDFEPKVIGLGKKHVKKSHVFVANICTVAGSWS